MAPLLRGCKHYALGHDRLSLAMGWVQWRRRCSAAASDVPRTAPVPAHDMLRRAPCRHGRAHGTRRQCRGGTGPVGHWQGFAPSRGTAVVLPLLSL